MASAAEPCVPFRLASSGRGGHRLRIERAATQAEAAVVIATVVTRNVASDCRTAILSPAQAMTAKTTISPVRRTAHAPAAITATTSAAAARASTSIPRLTRT